MGKAWRLFGLKVQSGLEAREIPSSAWKLIKSSVLLRTQRRPQGHLNLVRVTSHVSVLFPTLFFPISQWHHHLSYPGITPQPRFFPLPHPSSSSLSQQPLLTLKHLIHHHLPLAIKTESKTVLLLKDERNSWT